MTNEKDREEALEIAKRVILYREQKYKEYIKKFESSKNSLL